MTSLPPPATKLFPDDSIEKKVYNLVEKYAEYIPIPNDRNRLGFNLFLFVTGEGDAPEISVKNTKIKLEGITAGELATKLTNDLKDI